jgi:hypothetical protein
MTANHMVSSVIFIDFCGLLELWWVILVGTGKICLSGMPQFPDINDECRGILFCDEKVTLQEGWPLVGVAL